MNSTLDNTYRKLIHEYLPLKSLLDITKQAVLATKTFLTIQVSDNVYFAQFGNYDAFIKIYIYMHT